MPPTPVVFFRESDGSVPLLEWFLGLPEKAQDKCLVRLERLRLLGHELRRPEADYLRDGIHELRVTVFGVHYRMLYFFHRNKAIVVSHGIVKQREVPSREIDRAIRRRTLFDRDPVVHTHGEF